MRHLNDIHVYATVVELGSFTKAADKLGLSRALISREISKLEERYGVRLMNRTTRRLTLTESGEHFYKSCRTILDELESIEHQLTERQSEAQGLLKISAPQGFAELELSPLLNKFLEDNPKVDIEVMIHRSAPDLIKEGIDVAILGAFFLPDSSLVAKSLKPMELYLVASPKFIEKFGQPAHPLDLVNFPLISGIDPNNFEGIEFSDEDGNKIDAQFKSRAIVNDRDTIMSLVNKGIGYTFYSDRLKESDHQRYDLVKLLPKFNMPAINRYVVWPHRKHQPAKVSAFIKFIEEHFR